MKKHLYIVAIAALALNACGPTYVVHQDPPPPGEAAPLPPEAAPEISYQSFYDQLSPYGQWIDDPDYGYIWLPDVGPDFKPYATNGQWVYTEDGWTWASNYQWGWAAFHYGRWFFQDGYGWMWVPGNEWAPAWVSWRSSEDYYGWAPLGPNVGISMAYNPPPQYWCFVPRQYVSSPQIRNYYVNDSRNVTIINNTTVIYNNRTVRNVNYGRGPDPAEVGRFTGTAVRPVAIRRSNRPGEQYNNGNLTIYRPRVNAPQGNSTSGNRPSRIENIRNVRPVNTAVYNNGNDGRNRPGNNGGGRPDDNGRPGNRPVNTGNSNSGGQPVTRPNTPDTRPFTPPANQQPATRPATPPASQPPVNQAPVNNPRPAGRPNSEQPVNQQPQPGGQPVTRPYTPPANQQPATRPVTPPANQQPVNNPRPAGRPTNQPPPQQQQPARSVPQPQRPQPQPVQQSQPPRVQPSQPQQPAPRPAARPANPPKDDDKKDPRRP